MSIGNFKFVQVKFDESANNAPGLLDVTALMTPMSKYTFRAELDLVTKSNKYSGPQLNLSVLNRNTFKGAELLSLIIDANGGEFIFLLLESQHRTHLSTFHCAV
jgi:hypothetical protein